MRPQHALDGALPARLDAQNVRERGDDVEVARRVALYGREEALHGARVERALRVNLGERVEAVADARRLVAHARVLGAGGGHFGARVRKLARARLALGVERVEVRPRALNLLLQLRRLGPRLLVRGRGALALAREALGLRGQPQDRRFELAARLRKSLGHGRVRQKLAARGLDGRLGLGDLGQPARVSAFGLGEPARALLARLAHLHVLEHERLALRRDRGEARAHLLGLAADFL